MSRSQNRHDTLKWKKRREKHFADKCKLAKCPLCHPHKFIGGNTKESKKAKYRRDLNDIITDENNDA